MNTAYESEAIEKKRNRHMIEKKPLLATDKLIGDQFLSMFAVNKQRKNNTH